MWAAIMEAVGSKRAALLGFSEGAPMSVLFAATYPERTSHLILFGGFGRFTNTEDYKFMFTEEAILKSVKYWGTGAFIKSFAPSRAKDPAAVSQFAKFERLSASPGAYKAALQQNALIDVRPILPNVRVPTLILHSRADAMVPMIGPHSGLSKNTAVTWSRQRVTGYSRRSTDPDARFGARWHSNQPQRKLVCHCGLAFTPAKSK